MQTLKEKVVGAYEALKKAIFIIATLLITFIALRNSLIWHLEEVWGASSTLWKSIWAVFYRASGESDFNMHVIGSSLVPIVVFIVGNIFFVNLDLTGKPATLLKYRIQAEKAVPVSWKKYKNALKLVALNMFVVGPLFNLVVYPVIVWRGNECGYELPSFLITVWHLFCYIVVEEIGFYYFHRLLHHPKLYKHIHKIHHEWTAPTGIISVYSHPIEHILSNLWPIWFGPFLMGSHLSVAWLWYTVAVLNTTVSHNGYHLPFFPSNESHDYHHQKFNQNYGVMGVLDRLHGTDEGFRRSRNHDRHIVLLGLSSARELYPDPPKGKGSPCHQAKDTMGGGNFAEVSSCCT